MATKGPNYIYICVSSTLGEHGVFVFQGGKMGEGGSLCSEQYERVAKDALRRSMPETESRTQSRSSGCFNRHFFSVVIPPPPL